MAYINTITTEYPLSEVQIKSLFPNIAFPTPFVPPEGFSFVFPAPAGSYDHLLERVVEGAPVLTNKGTWEQTWTRVELSPGEIQARAAQEESAQAISRKQTRDTLVGEIKVTTSSGKTFDGDEVSQTRMARAILALNAAGGTTQWKLADNTVALVDSDELTEALMLAGTEQTKIWME